MTGMPLRKRQDGFTIIELITTVTVIGLLATVAIPALVEYMRQSRTVEVVEGIAKIATGARIYHTTNSRLPCMDTMSIPGGGCGSEQDFTPLMDHKTACEKFAGLIPAKNVEDFRVPLWEALLFTPEGNLRYRYRWKSLSFNDFSEGEIVAIGDLDCDGIPSVWSAIVRTEAKTNTITRQGAPTPIGDPLE